MINRELTEYIRKERFRGVPDADIKKSLREGGGWDANDIIEGFTAVPSDLSDTSNVRLSEIGRGAEVQRKGEKVEAKSGSNLKTVWIVVIVLILLALAGAASAYVYYTQFDESQAPYEVLRTSVASTNDIVSAHYSVDASIGGSLQISTTSVAEALESDDDGLSSTDSAEFDFSSSIDGSIALDDSDSAKADVSYSFNLSATAGPLSIHMAGAASAKILDGIVYIKVDNLEDIPLPPEVAQYIGKWIRIDLTQHEEFAEIGNVAELYSEEVFGNDQVQDDFKVYFSGDKFKSLVESSISELDDEKIDGHKSHHYRISLTADNWRSLYNDLSQILLTNAILDLEELRNTGEEELDIVFEVMENMALDIWIDKGKEKFMRKSVFDLPITFDEEIDGDQVNADMLVRYETMVSAINEDFTVDIPDEVVLIEDIVEDLTPFLRTQETSETRNLQRISDINQIEVALDLYFDQQSPGRYPIQIVQSPIPVVLEGGFLSVIPEDPLGIYPYQYISNSSGSGYCLGAVLEDDSSLHATCENVKLDEQYNYSIGENEGGDEPASVLIRSVLDFRGFLNAAVIDAIKIDER